MGVLALESRPVTRPPRRSAVRASGSVGTGALASGERAAGRDASPALAAPPSAAAGRTAPGRVLADGEGPGYRTGVQAPPWRADSVAASAIRSAMSPSCPVGLTGFPRWTASTNPWSSAA